MRTSLRRNVPLLLSSIALATLLGACGASPVGPSPAADPATLALSASLASSTSDAGTLLCSPAAAQVSACAGHGAGDA